MPFVKFDFSFGIIDENRNKVIFIHVDYSMINVLFHIVKNGTYFQV